MAAFPIITTNSPAVTVTTANSSLTYDQILFSLNTDSYLIKKIDIQAGSLSQLSEVLTYTRPSAEGILYSDQKSPVVDMYQFQATLNGLIDEFILDALTTWGFNLEPNQTVQLLFFGDEVSFTNALNDRNSITEGDRSAPAQIPVKKDNECIIPFIIGILAGTIVVMIMKKGNND